MKEATWQHTLPGGRWEWSRQVLSLAGQITQKNTGKGIDGLSVHVQSPEVKKSTSTDGTGTFKFCDLLEGQYQLTVVPTLGTARYDMQIEAATYHERNGMICHAQGKGEWKPVRGQSEESRGIYTFTIQREN